jgi:hypothetical protein
MGFTIKTQGVKGYEGLSLEISVSEASNHGVDDEFEVKICLI